LKVRRLRIGCLRRRCFIPGFRVGLPFFFPLSCPTPGMSSTSRRYGTTGTSLRTSTSFWTRCRLPVSSVLSESTSLASCQGESNDQPPFARCIPDRPLDAPYHQKDSSSLRVGFIYDSLVSPCSGGRRTIAGFGWLSMTAGPNVRVVIFALRVHKAARLVYCEPTTLETIYSTPS